MLSSVQCAVCCVKRVVCIVDYAGRSVQCAVLSLQCILQCEMLNVFVVELSRVVGVRCQSQFPLCHTGGHTDTRLILVIL